MSSTWFEVVQRKTEKRTICSRKAKMYWNEKVSNREPTSVGLVQIYSDKTESMMKL